MTKKIPLSIRDFAVPSPRTGSIDAYSGYRSSPLEGIEIHQAIQQKRALDHETYRAEVSCSRTFEHRGYTFQVEGRMDGIFEDQPVKIEEIKSTFNIRELKKALESAGHRHPYALQLLTYGYFHWLNHESLPKLSFHLVSTRNRETIDYSITLDISDYETWLAKRLEELADQADRAFKRTAKRQKISHSFPFPFSKPRTGQVELIQAIEDGMKENRPLML
ncbi:MAG: ATP-dependent DNA helicase, partial [Proteobacteria bacterium]